MDSLVRVPKKIISDYFKEFNRVLKSKGRIFLHLPCRSIRGSWGRVFTSLSLRNINNFCRRNNFNQIKIDKKIIVHGVILEAIKS